MTTPFQEGKTSSFFPSRRAGYERQVCFYFVAFKMLAGGVSVSFYLATMISLLDEGFTNIFIAA